MKKVVKTLVTLGLSMALAMGGGVLTSFAVEISANGNRPKLFGQELQQCENVSSNLLGIIVGDCTSITEDDFTDGAVHQDYLFNENLPLHETSIDKAKAFSGIYVPEMDEVTRFAYREIFEVNAIYGTFNAGNDNIYNVYIATLPDGTDLSNVGELQKYLIYVDGSRNGNNTSTAQNNVSEKTDKDYGAWASNETGWWIQFKDGSYLTNAWWQSPTSGLWYYMGADGYMVTNTVIDGYTINADGAWVQ